MFANKACLTNGTDQYDCDHGLKISEANEQSGPRLWCWDGITVILRDCLYTRISHSKYGFKLNLQALPWHQSAYRLFFHSVNSNPFFAYPDCAHFTKFRQHLFFFFLNTHETIFAYGIHTTCGSDLKCRFLQMHLSSLVSQIAASFASLTTWHITTMSSPE